MNVERMLYLADQLENPTDPKLAKVTFNMRDFSSAAKMADEAISCGTAACIGGHACILFGMGRICGHVAQEILDLTWKQEQQLFYNKGLYVCESGLGDATREEAVAAIRRMVQQHIDAQVSAMEPGALIPVMQRPGMSVAESLREDMKDAVCR